jgi:hypothetical protein
LVLEPRVGSGGDTDRPKWRETPLKTATHKAQIRTVSAKGNHQNPKIATPLEPTASPGSRAEPCARGASPVLLGRLADSKSVIPGGGAENPPLFIHKRTYVRGRLAQRSTSEGCCSGAPQTRGVAWAPLRVRQGGSSGTSYFFARGAVTAPG